MRISDWSSDVCSSDLTFPTGGARRSTMSYQLDFAPHLGFPTPDNPLFGALCGSTDPERQIAFAAEHGFRRIQDPFAAQRSVADQEGIGDAAAAAGLGQGCFAYAPLARAFQPWWLG